MIHIADTNVLLNNPEVLEEYEVVIPSHVNREVEHLELTRKSDRTLQWQIRRFKRIADEMNCDFFNLKDYKFTLDDELDPQYTDNILLQVAHDNGWGMITNDRLLRQKCKQFNIPIVKVETATNFIEHKGYKEAFILPQELNEVYQSLKDNTYGLLVNEYIVFYNDANTEELEVLDILKWNGNSLVALPRNKKGKLDLSFKSERFGDFTPYDAQQMMAVDSILNNQLTVIRGRAGSGKSKIALETAWHLIERGQKSTKYGFDRLVIFCNPVGARDSAELGFYKGDRLDKLLQTVGTMLKSKFGDELEIKRLIEDKYLDILPIVDIRGYETSGVRTILWIIESQNMTSDLMKLSLQRVGDDCKVVIDGDYAQQVDKDAYAIDNGMKRVSEVFRGEDLYGEIELQTIYRSKIADIADKM
jgi:predicted ribonuclease YlaK